MTSPRSILIGAALAALAPGVCMAIYAFIAATSENEEILDSVIGSLMLCGITSIFSVPPTLIIGVPYLFWLRSN